MELIIIVNLLKSLKFVELLISVIFICCLLYWLVRELRLLRLIDKLVIIKLFFVKLFF